MPLVETQCKDYDTVLLKSKNLWNKSLKAAAIHLIFSLLFVSFVAFLVFFIWYPSPLATATGVVDIFCLILFVDAFLGPLLTLLVYKEDKKQLKYDLAIILLIQLAALGYGIYTLAQARPVYIAFHHNRFDLVRLNDIEEPYVEGAENKWLNYSWSGPKFVFAELPDDMNKVEKENFELMNKLGAKIAYQPKFYHSINDGYSKILSEARPMDKLFKINLEIDSEEFKKKYQNVKGWLPLKAPRKNQVVLIDAKGKPLKIVNLEPWSQRELTEVITTTQ